MKLETIQRGPTTVLNSTPLIFLHGAFHGAWCWNEHFLDFFAKQGYMAQAISLRGHGNSPGQEHLRWASIDDYMADLKQLVERSASPPILVGHSMGCYVIEKYLETENPKPIGVVMLAPYPTVGFLPMLMRWLPKHLGSIAKMLLSMNPYELVATPRKYQTLMLQASMSDDLVQKYHGRLRGESFRVLLEGTLYKLPKPAKVKQPVPMLIIGGDADYLFTPQEFRKTAAAYHAEVEIVKGGSHMLMLDDHWQAVGMSILKWIQQAIRQGQADA